MPGAFDQNGGFSWGPLANRPATNVGIALYFATDVGKMFWSDMLTWHEQGANDLPLNMASGNYYFPTGQGATTSLAPPQGSMRVQPMQIPHDLTLSRIGVETTIIGDAGSVWRLGIYADNGSGMPGALVLDCGTVPADVVGVAEIVINKPLAAGSYWAAAVSQLCPVTTPTGRAAAATQGIVPIAMSTIPTANLVVTTYVLAGVVGALPDPFGVPTSVTSAATRIFVKVA